ncbi:MAG: PAS domain S-box protein [Magnetospirillum sp.]|nr:MAG: PAS domain S-box protein [Magnetospirillum sp.]
MPYTFGPMSNFSTSDDVATGVPAETGGSVRPQSRWRARLAAGLVASCLVVLTAWQIWGGYREELENIKTLSTALARVSEEHVTGIMRGIDVVLAEMAELVSDDGVIDRDAVNTVMLKRVRQFSFIRNAFLVDSNGLVVADTLTGSTRIDVHDREYFTALASDSGRRLFITPPLRSRALDVVSIFVARAVRKPDGSLLGVAVVTVDPRLFEAALLSVLPGVGGRATLIRNDGIVLARQPESERWRGKSVADGEVFLARAGGVPSGVLRGRAGTDGAERMVAYRSLEAYPLVMAVGMAMGPAMGRWRADAAAHAAVAFVLASVLIGLATLSDRRQAERYRAQMELAASEARFRLLNDRSPIGIVQAGADGSCLYANDRWVELTGRRREELLGHKWCDVVDPRDRAAVAKTWADLAWSGGEITGEMRILAPDGGIRWVLERASALGGPGGSAGLVVTFEDITAARDDKLKLKLSEEKFAKAFQGSPDAQVISTMADGSYVEVNNAFCRLLGYSRTELMGSDSGTLGVWANPADRERLIGMVTQDGQVEDFETILRRKDGETMVVLISVQQIMVAGEPCLLFICRDVSERREMEARTRTLLAKLDASNKELEQFAYVTSHDLQEPLRMIAGYAQLIERRYRGRLDSDADEFIAFLVDGAKRMQGMIQDLLEYSRVERLGGAFMAFDASTALEDVRLNLSAAVSDAGGRIDVGPMPEVIADRSQFIRLFQNLIGNALKYRHPDRPPKIAVNAERQGDVWLFAVTDNGIGISSEYFDRIFLVFQRLHTRDQYPGSGIGLAICKKIVERHGGQLWVASDPEHGSVFRFTLPVRQAATCP